MIISISLGSSKAGLTLEAMLINPNGSNNGSAITTGFVAIGDGNYVLDTAVTQSFQGIIKIYESGQTVVLAIASINPTVLASAGLDNVAVEGMNIRQAISVMSAVLTGRLSIAGNDVTIKAIDDAATTRVVATTTATGERTAVTITVPS